ncbi:hypothetical protein F5883DRAFT_541856 [Diaporthe sp. PMI_573]|nr:hypothetical protein F5883DRAFT_541856 [Diaporthaceae sp. PMI_573]
MVDLAFAAARFSLLTIAFWAFSAFEAFVTMGSGSSSSSSISLGQFSCMNLRSSALNASLFFGGIPAVNSSETSSSGVASLFFGLARL